MATKPWEPASVLKVVSKDSKYTYRWITKENANKRIAEGWEIIKGVSPDKAKGISLTLADGSQIDSVISVRNLVLARMPVEMANSRNEYYRKMSDDLVKQTEQKFRTDSGGQAYGEVKVKKGE